VSRKQAEGGDRGNARAGEIAKPHTSNVSAQAVQATITSPRTQESPRSHSAASSAADQAHSDPGAPKSGPPATSAKVYSFHANTIPGSNAYSGRARGLMINFHAEGGTRRSTSTPRARAGGIPRAGRRVKPPALGDGHHSSSVDDRWILFTERQRAKT
jgi:hypothetical protein